MKMEKKTIGGLIVSSISIPGLVFIGSTLWADVNTLKEDKIDRAEVVLNHATVVDKIKNNRIIAHDERVLIENSIDNLKDTMHTNDTDIRKTISDAKTTILTQLIVMESRIRNSLNAHSAIGMK